ncbi:MAG: hypothetical protein ACKV2V_16205 [Blastocatellia bacterium]
MKLFKSRWELTGNPLDIPAGENTGMQEKTGRGDEMDVSNLLAAEFDETHDLK